MTEIREILPDNPASRLLNILNKAITIDFKENDQSGAIWAKVLNVKSEPSELMLAYSKLFILADDAYEAVIKFYPRQQSTHAKWRQAISTCLTNNSPYHHPWSSVVKQLKSPNIIDMLQVAEDNLAHYVMRISINEFSIEKLKEEFNELREKISKERSFSGQLKNFLIGELEKILTALDHFDLNGSAAIRDSIYNVVSNSDLEKNNTFSFRKQLCAFLVIAATSISIINDVADLPESLEFLKGLISQDSEHRDPSSPPKRPALPKELAVFRKEEELPERK